MVCESPLHLKASPLLKTFSCWEKPPPKTQLPACLLVVNSRPSWHLYPSLKEQLKGPLLQEAFSGGDGPDESLSLAAHTVPARKERAALTLSIFNRCFLVPLCARGSILYGFWRCDQAQVGPRVGLDPGE